MNIKHTHTHTRVYISGLDFKRKPEIERNSELIRHFNCTLKYILYVSLKTDSSSDVIDIYIYI